ncbi:MAG: efflux RND transporter permease subunit, partial [Planctomycetota bacterium]|nr:efflux RND transporter permease subunit [Planctomycetota bacterium]
AFFDQGQVIENSLNTLYKNALYGGLLAVVILALFFRRMRMTLLVAAAIPLSLTIAVTVLYLGGSSLNIATMMGLTLAVGMLIDNAIVVVEAILRRRELGEDPRDAAARGTGEVALAVLTATLTTIVVFAPVIFLSDSTNVRIWMGSIGGPIAYALIGSLGVALVLVPLGSIHLRRRSQTATVKPRLDGERSAWFGRVLGAALKQRFVVVVCAILFVGSGAFPYKHLSRKGTMGRGGGPVRIALRFPRHYTMRDADNAIKEYEKYVLGVKDRLGLRGIYARFDRYGGMVMCWQSNDAKVSKDDVRDEFKRDFPTIPGVWRSLESVAMGGQTTVTLEGEDATLLEATLDRIEARLGTLPSVAETSRERGAGLQELQVRMDQDAIAQGKVVPDQVRGLIGWVVRGARLRDFKAEGRDLPLLVEFDPDNAVEAADLANLLIPTDDGMKPLGSLTRSRIRSSSSTIQRREGRRVAELQVVGNKDDDQEFHKDVQAALAGAKLPPGIRFEVGGSWEDLQQSFDALFDALLLAGVLVFLLTGILFEDFLLPLAVMVAAVPAGAGAVWALYLSGKPMDELSYLGVILLIGVVVNNGIVLIDRAQQRRREGLPLRAAVRAAGGDRVRPVIMTAVTTIVGLLPMAVFKGGNDEIPYDTLATAVIGGLVFATIVTLLLVPVVFTLLVGVAAFIRRRWKRAFTFARA